jgi:hypothetical protein
MGINLTMSSANSTVCADCSSHPESYNPIQENMLPLWFDDNGTPMFTVPGELSDMREGEKLLIQMNAPYVPFVHIKNGTLGIKGHVCSFPQRVQDSVTSLPRVPNSAVFVKMVRQFKSEDGEFGIKSFVIQKRKVLKALQWLVKYNPIYREEVTIDEANFDWMNGAEEQELPCSDASIVESDDTDSARVNDDLGPAEQQCIPTLNLDDELDDLKTCGLHVGDATPSMSEEDNIICKAIQGSTEKIPSVPWPYVSPDPVNEYDGNAHPFCKAFPWLFPGGVGDYNDYRERTISATDWASRMLQYEDGRFARDKMWCFYALNFTTRRRNQTSGRFFVDGFHKGAPESVEELQRRLKEGDTSFVDKITYYSQRVKGSAGYWRAKRAELYSWINYHVKSGHGMPNFFITLSCAEYFWPDILWLVNQRLAIAGSPLAVSCLDLFQDSVVRIHGKSIFFCFFARAATFTRQNTHNPIFCLYRARLLGSILN